MIGIGIISALLTGTALPAQSVLVARILSFELMYGQNPAYFNSEIRWELLYMLIISIVGAIMVGVQYYIFLTLGCDVVNKMRMDVYRKVIRLPLSWIQDKNNNAEQITLTLGVNMFTINNVITKYVSKLAMCISNVLSGVILAFVF
jgi:ATP-binding cassette, subfamily B (MDR/TAP), member 1